MSPSRFHSLSSFICEKTGLVDYDALLQDEEGLQHLQRNVDIVASARDMMDPALTPACARLSFLINAYNILVLHAMCNIRRDNPQYKGHLSLWGKIKFFYFTRFTVCGHRMSLYTLENTYLRSKSLGFAEGAGSPAGDDSGVGLKKCDPRVESRIHFVINCGSFSCPRLPSEWLPEDKNELERVLDQRTRSFIIEEGGALYLESTNTLQLSCIFKWYSSDFKCDGGVRAFVLKYWNTTPPIPSSSQTASLPVSSSDPDSSSSSSSAPVDTSVSTSSALSDAPDDDSLLTGPEPISDETAKSLKVAWQHYDWTINDVHVSQSEKLSRPTPAPISR